MTVDGTIKVKVTLMGTLLDFLPSGADKNTAELEMPAGSTLGDAISALNIPEDRPKLLMLNSRMEKPGKALAAGDEITAMPPLRGGC